MTPFKQVTVEYLKSSFTPHPEILQTGSPFSAQVSRWMSGKEYGVITRKGGLLAFVMCDLPDAVPRDAIGYTTFNKSKLTTALFARLQKHDAIRCKVNGRYVFWLINPKHQDLLPLPVFDGSAS